MHLIPRWMLTALIVVSCASLDTHLAPDLVIEEASYPETYAGPKPITARQALRSALHSLQHRGVRDIRLCHIHWVVAGIGAAIIHATGRWEKDGAVFNAFAVAINDGSDAKYGLAGGTENFVMARGVDRSGAEIFYDSDRILRYGEMEPEAFGFVSREELMELPARCADKNAHSLAGGVGAAR